MKVLFIPSAVGRGHVARCRPLVHALTDRGHACSAAVLGHRPGRLLDDLRPVALPERPLPVPASPAAAPPAFLRTRDVAMSFALHTRDDETSLAILAFLVEAVARARPDVVVVDQVVLSAPVARAAGVPVVGVAGRCLLTGDALRPAGIDAAYALADLEPDVERSMREARPLLERLAEQIARDRLLGTTTRDDTSE